LRSSGQKGPGYHDWAGSQKIIEWGRQDRSARKRRDAASIGTIIDILHELKRTAPHAGAPESNRARQTGGKNETAA
jgi:hypothetical protein